jgi:hypothetical protein
MFIAKISPGQEYWLPRIKLKYKNLGWLDVDTEMYSFSDCVVYQRPMIRIRFEKDKQFMVVEVNFLGQETIESKGEI